MSHSDSDTSIYPLLPSERTWSAGKITVMWMITGVATWCYIIGEYIGYYLPFVSGAIAFIAGSFIGGAILLLAAIPISMRYGIDTIMSAVPQFGTRGRYLAIFFSYLVLVGWNSILIVFFGKSITQLINITGVTLPIDTSLIAPLATIFIILLIFSFLIHGLLRFYLIAFISGTVIVISSLWMFWVLWRDQHQAILAAAPLYSSSNWQWNYITVIELGIAMCLSWWPYSSAITRKAPRASYAVMPIFLAVAVFTPIISLLGLAAVLVTGSSDPLGWLVSIGGTTYGLVAILFVIFANIGTAAIGVYAAALSLRSLPWLNTQPWILVLMLAMMPMIMICLLIPDLFYTHFGTFAAFLGVAFAPICGIQITDYFVLRRGKVKVRALYNYASQSDYYYWFGFNPAMILALLAGYAVYIYLLNPLTFVSHMPYEWTTASIPTALIAGLVYYGITRLWIIPAGHGGYQ